MYKFNRETQRELLESLYDATPHSIPNERQNYFQTAFGGEDALIANLFYLKEHGLINVHITQVLQGNFIFGYESMHITAKGIDFILHDGGLSAILNVQTIKLHRDTVVVLEDLIAISNMTAEEKEKAKSTLGELSTEALKALVQALTTGGLTKLLGQ